MVLYDYSGNQANGAEDKRGGADGLLVIVCGASVEIPVNLS